MCAGQGQRVYHAVPVIYKGSGFYTTDYGRPKAPVEKETDGKDGKDSKSTSDSKSSSTEKASSTSSESSSDSTAKATSDSSA
jgi:predicted nucleic acid-binding Zn ribbon protein